MLGGWISAYTDLSSKLTYVERYSTKGWTADQKKAFLMNLARNGFHAVIQVGGSPNEHWVYLYNEKSVQAGTPWSMNSISSSHEASFRLTNNVVSYTKRIKLNNDGDTLQYKYEKMNLVNIFKVESVTKQRYYTIRYFPEEGSGAMAETKVICKQETKLRKNIFSRSGYRFAGWVAKRQTDNAWPYVNPKTGGLSWYIREADALKKGFTQKKTFSDQQAVSATTKVIGEVVEFHAVWKKIPQFPDRPGRALQCETGS